MNSMQEFNADAPELERRDFLKTAPLAAITGGALFAVARSSQAAPETTESSSTRDKLVALWTTGDRDVALKMLFMYLNASKKNGWWKEVTLVIWGPSAKLTAEDDDIQNYLKRMMGAGIIVKACVACARMYGVDQQLADLGVTVKGMGDELTSYIKEGRQILTF